MVVITYESKNGYVNFDCDEFFNISFELSIFEIEKVKTFISALEDIVSKKDIEYDMLFMLEFENEHNTFQIRIDDNQSNIHYFGYIIKNKKRTLGMFNGNVELNNEKLLKGLKEILLPLLSEE
jgi:hypothetical protein